MLRSSLQLGGNRTLARLLNGMSALIAVIAIGVGAVAFTHLVHRRAAAADSRRREQQTWVAMMANGHLMGSTAARVTVVEFGDFECFACAQLEPSVVQLERQYGDRMNLLFLNDPIVELHPYAWAAALASECAGEQGRFGEYHDVLFNHQSSLGLESWMAYASQAKVSDMAKFDECVKSKRMQGRLEREQRAAYDLGITNTPTFVVDGQMYNGSEAQLDSAVRAALAVR